MQIYKKIPSPTVWPQKYAYITGNAYYEGIRNKIGKSRKIKIKNPASAGFVLIIFCDRFNIKYTHTAKSFTEKIEQRKLQLNSLKNPTDLFGKLFKHHRDSANNRHNKNDSLRSTASDHAFAIRRCARRNFRIGNLRWSH